MRASCLTLAVLGVLALPLQAQPTPSAAATGEAIVKARCSNCHATGKDGAPRIGDRDAWIKRASQGVDALVMSAIRGHGKMPARGGLAPLTDPEMKAAVSYMVETSLKPAPK